jgi:hypothetical protein
MEAPITIHLTILMAIHTCTCMHMVLDASSLRVVPEVEVDVFLLVVIRKQARQMVS